MSEGLKGRAMRMVKASVCRAEYTTERPNGKLAEHAKSQRLERGHGESPDDSAQHANGREDLHGTHDGLQRLNLFMTSLGWLTLKS